MTFHRELRTKFGKISNLYNQVRPDYPPELIEKTITISKLKPGSKILEIGTGTGIATLPFAKKGFDIIGSDISREQLAIAKLKLEKYSNVSLKLSAFETMCAQKDCFDLILSAQAFHWIDPKVGYRKVHRLLKTNGHLGLLSNYEVETSEIEREIGKLFSLHCPKYPGRDYVNRNKVQERLMHSNLFDQFKKLTLQRKLNYPLEKYLGFLRSFSWVLALNKKQNALFFKDVKKLLSARKRIIVPVESVLLIARKKSFSCL